MNPDVWLLHVYRDEIRELHGQRGFALGQIEANVKASYKIFERNSELYKVGTLFYMLKQAEINEYLKYREGSLHGIRLAKQAAKDVPLDMIDSLPVGLLHKVSLLRTLARLHHKTRSLGEALYALHKAHQITQAAGLKHQIERVHRDAMSIGVALPQE
jgi:hypothetical protein